MDLSLFGALLGGVLTLLSPCSVMLLPAFFAYAFTSPGALLARSGVFLLGLLTSLVPLGVLAGTLGAWVVAHRSGLMTVASIVIIVFGLVLMFGVRLPGVTRQRGLSSASSASVYSLGLVYGLAGGCAGPVFGAVLAMASFGGSALAGGVTMVVFAIGMTIPLLLLALLWDRLPVVRRLMRPRDLVIGRWRNAWTNVIGGALTAGIGVLLLGTDGTASLGGVLGASEQARLEGDAMRATAGVPDAFVIAALVVAGIAALVWWRIWAARTAVDSKP